MRLYNSPASLIMNVSIFFFLFFRLSWKKKKALSLTDVSPPPYRSLAHSLTRLKVVWALLRKKSKQATSGIAKFQRQSRSSVKWRSCILRRHCYAERRAKEKYWAVCDSLSKNQFFFLENIFNSLKQLMSNSRACCK